MEHILNIITYNALAKANNKGWSYQQIRELKRSIKLIKVDGEAQYLPHRLCCAIIAFLPNSYIDYDTREVGVFDDDYTKRGEMVLPCHMIDSPYVRVLRQELYINLSDNAKEMLKIILNPPPKACTPKTMQLTIMSLENYFRRRHWSTEQLQQTLDELQHFLQSIVSLHEGEF